MAVVADKVFNEALFLPSDARISLVEKFLASLNIPTHTEIESLWAKKADRQFSQIDQGEVELISGEEVFAKISQMYQI